MPAVREHLALQVADLAVSVYVSLADQGGYDMARFEAIRRWTARVASQPAWVPLLPAG